MLIAYYHDYNFILLLLKYLSLGKFNNSQVFAIFSYDHPHVTPKKIFVPYYYYTFCLQLGYRTEIDSIKAYLNKNWKKTLSTH